MIWWVLSLRAAQEGHQWDWVLYGWQWFNFIVLKALFIVIVLPKLKGLYRQKIQNLAQESEKLQAEIQRLEEEIQELNQKIQDLRAGWNSYLEQAQVQLLNQHAERLKQNEEKWRWLLKGTQQDLDAQLEQFISQSRKLLVEEMFREIEQELAQRPDLSHSWSLDDLVLKSFEQYLSTQRFERPS